MKCSLLIILFSILLFPQSNTYFIKYRSSVTESFINQKVNSKMLFDSILLKSPINYDVDYLAKGILKDDAFLGKILKVSFENDTITETHLLNLLDDPMVEYVQQARTYRVDFIPNDSLVNDQWALKKIKAFEAWNITQGSDTVLLAIIDTGIDYLHEDLKSKIYLNYQETGQDLSGNDKRYNGVDDDSNGFIDDYMGWDFTDRLGFPFDSTGGDYLVWDNDPADDYGHGTYVAGTAAAETNNKTGIAGTAPGIKILNLRAFDPSGYGEEDDVAAAILYAVQMGVKVINMSFGDNSFSYVLRDVIRYAHSRNVVLIASSGNTGTDEPHYPSGYSEVISVGNSTENDFISSTSNWGSTLDLVAPGSLIHTTALKSAYAVVSGTSLAAPFVSASACLILSRGNYTNDEIREILKSTTDDIGITGWDTRSGAGRLNIYKALSVTAPSVIRFDYPKQDHVTLEDSLIIRATVLSAYFGKYELYFGTGITPEEWKLLVSGQNQFSGSEIFILSTDELPDSVYTLRLVVYQSNGRTTEERVNFHISRKPPDAQIVTIGPALYGKESTILASVHTDIPSIVKIFFRKANSGEEFRFVTIDGFATNNQFVKYFHYGIIPKELLIPDTDYEVYLEAENLTGLKSVLKNESENFLIRTSFNSRLFPEFELPYRLPFGQLYNEPVNITYYDSTEILFNGFYPGIELNYGIYWITGNNFVKSDSIKNRIPRYVGDFNGNGKTDILSTIQRNAFIDEQSATGSTSFINVLTDSSDKFWASSIEDIDGDDEPEVLVFSSDTTLTIWKLTNTFSRNESVDLQNFSAKGLGNNYFSFPKIVTADTDNNGKREIWTVDDDGDILAYESDGSSFRNFNVISTGLAGSAEYLTVGDFNGDGKDDIAVMLKSFKELHIAPFNYLLVFDADGVIFQQAFLDPSTEFNTSFRTVWNSIKFADIDNDNKDELITFSFPYSYIFKHYDSEIKIISYKENINSRVIFTGDLNKNGITEVAFPFPDGIKFFEFSAADKTPHPFHAEGYGVDSSTVYLKWEGEGEKYFVYKGTSEGNVSLYDSTVNNFYEDKAVSNQVTFYYSVQAFNSQRQINLSDLSSLIPVYVHNKSVITKIENNNPNTLQVYFSEKINTTILNLQSFLVERINQYSRDSIYPVSISPATQYSYLITFKNELLIGTYRLIVTELVDYYNSPVENTGNEFHVLAVSEPEKFYIVSHQILNPYLLKLVFNLEVDSTSAADLSNYSFEPYNMVEKAEIDYDRKTIFLYLEKTRPVGAVGKEYVLIISNLYSSEISGRIKINSGAGSSIVISSFANDLSGVYVYPNPWKPGIWEQKVTFAGLPRKTKIVIFNMGGEKLKTLDENDGNGGTDFNLTDEKGDRLGSGIYFYRVVRHDESNNEIEEKLGKFAVIR